MNKTAIQVFAKWQVKAGNLDAVLALLPQVVQLSNAEAGNLHYTVFQDRDNPHLLILSEAYRDDDALNEHRNSAHFQDIVVAQIVPLLEAREVVLSHQLIL
jgi:autoinducer 2-degrading protein